MTLVLSASLAALLGALGSAFVSGGFLSARGEGQRAAAVVRSAGFDPDQKLENKKIKRASITRADLEKDHGDKWELVDRILKGKKAESPEAMLRARFTAVRYKDSKFLAATEECAPGGGLSTAGRADIWAKRLGLEEPDFFDAVFMFFAKDRNTILQNPGKLEVLDADATEVEFKVYGTDGSSTHERSKFLSDPKWGFVYAGEDADTKMK